MGEKLAFNINGFLTGFEFDSKINQEMGNVVDVICWEWKDEISREQ